MRRHLSMPCRDVLLLFFGSLVGLSCADKQGWAPTCTSPDVESHYDFVEIGTNDFDTLIELARPCTRGLSVDALQFYLDRLPSKPRVHKVHAAIVEYTPPRHIEFITARYADLARHNMTHLQGSGGASEHAAKGLSDGLRKHNLTHLLQRTRAPAMTFRELLGSYGVASIGYLKIDVNGLEPPILRSLAAACAQRPTLWPHRLTYEQGHIDMRQRQPLINLFTSQGGYVPALKPASVQRRSHEPRYNKLTWDMVLERQRPEAPAAAHK